MKKTALAHALTEYLTGGVLRPLGLTKTALKQALEAGGLAARLPAELPAGRLRCAAVLDWLAPAMERLCPSVPADGWLRAAYAELAHGLFPDPARADVSKEERQALGLYTAALAWLLEREQADPDPLTDCPEVTEEELSRSLIRAEYEAFRRAVAQDRFVALMRLGREIMPFDPASHTLGVHWLALRMARQAAAAGLDVDVPLVSAAALSHDVGKFGCRGEDARRIPFLHYYYTYRYLTRRGLPRIAHIAANHSTWDLEFENLSLESLLLIYADFRVRGTRDKAGKEHVQIYTLAESYRMIYSKLCDMTDAKVRRYQTAFTKLSDFEHLLTGLGLNPDPMGEFRGQAHRTDAALLSSEEILPAFCDLTFENNLRLMYLISKEVTFGQLLEQARSEKNLHRIRTYLRLFEEYSTYMTGENKRRTLALLYELLMHRQGDVRRAAAKIMGRILANSGPRYRKELPNGAAQTAVAPAAAEFLAESVDLWIRYMDRCLHPDHKIAPKHAQRISNSLKIIVRSLLESCPPEEQPHYLSPLLERLFTAEDEARFVLADALYYVPHSLLTADQTAAIAACLLKMLSDADLPLTLLALRRLEQLLPRMDRETAARTRAAAAALRTHPETAVSYLAARLLGDLPGDLPIAQLYLGNLKNAVHWIVKLTQVEALTDDLQRRPENAFHTAMHLSNLLSVSEHLPVRERAGACLVRIAPLLSADQKNEIIVDLLRELETGQDEISTYIPRYVGALLPALPEKELTECLDFLEDLVRASTVRAATAALRTLSRLLAAPDLPEGQTARILGLLLTGVWHDNDTIHQSALTVLCEDVLAGPDLPLCRRRAIFDRSGKKLLTVLREPRPGRINFFTQSAVLNHVYRFLVACRMEGADAAPVNPRPVAFFPGTFDPFTAGHKRIVQEIAARGFEVYLAIDEFSWSKQPLPKLLRRQIAGMSIADCDDVYLFPDAIPINIAFPEDLRRLAACFPGRDLYLVTGSDVICNASAYRSAEPGSAGDYNHVVFLRSKEDLPSVREKLRGAVRILTLPEFYETVSSTRIREYVDRNMDISMLVDPMVQSFIYGKGLYLRAPQYKRELQLLDRSLRFTREGRICRAELARRSDGLRLGAAAGRTVSGAELYAALGDLDAAEFLRRHTSGRILLVETVTQSPATHADLRLPLLNELLVRSLETEHTYALLLRRPDDGLDDLPAQLGFVPVPEHPAVLYVDMRTPVVLIEDVLTRLKLPHRTDPAVVEAVGQTRPRLRLALAALFPGRLVASFDAEQLSQSLLEHIQRLNGVWEAGPGTGLGPSMCVPYGKILSGETVPHTVTKSLHVDKAYVGDCHHFIIRPLPGYSELSVQAGTVRSFHRPVLLVDDLLHRGYRLEKLDAIFKAADLEIDRIVVSILSGRGKDLMDLQGREVECEYFIPNLRYWFTESLLYPFIGGDSIDGVPASDGLLPSTNLILPYEFPSYLRDVGAREITAFSTVMLENAAAILRTLEQRHQQLFSTALTIRRLAEAFLYPRVPYRGKFVKYDLGQTASAYVEDDLRALGRIQRS